MVQKLIQNLFMLLFSPRKYWNELSERGLDGDIFLSRYFYPLLGITALSVFGGYYTRETGLKVEMGLVIVTIVKYFVSYNLLMALIAYFCKRAGNVVSKESGILFVGSSLSVPMFLNTVVNFFPNPMLLILLSVFAVWPILQGVKYYFPLAKENRGFFASVFAILIPTLPLLLGHLFHLLMPQL